jgi:hypothetical protein
MQTGYRFEQVELPPSTHRCCSAEFFLSVLLHWHRSHRDGDSRLRRLDLSASRLGVGGAHAEGRQHGLEAGGWLDPRGLARLRRGNDPSTSSPWPHASHDPEAGVIDQHLLSGRISTGRRT